MNVVKGFILLFVYSLTFAALPVAASQQLQLFSATENAENETSVNSIHDCRESSYSNKLTGKSLIGKQGLRFNAVMFFTFFFSTQHKNVRLIDVPIRVLHCHFRL